MIEFSTLKANKNALNKWENIWLDKWVNKVLDKWMWKINRVEVVMGARALTHKC